MNKVALSITPMIRFSIACAAMNDPYDEQLGKHLFSIACAAMNTLSSVAGGTLAFSIACAAMNKATASGRLL